jgi:chromosome segregation ATPase
MKLVSGLMDFPPKTLAVFATVEDKLAHSEMCELVYWRALREARHELGELKFQIAYKSEHGETRDQKIESLNAMIERVVRDSDAERADFAKKQAAWLEMADKYESVISGLYERLRHAKVAPSA